MPRSYKLMDQLIMIEADIQEISKAANEYIQTVKKLSKRPILRNAHKLYMHNARRRLKQSKEIEAHKLMTLIPNSPSTLNSIDFSMILKKSLHSPKKRFLIPETLMSNGRSLVFYYNFKGQIHSISGSGALSAFFAHTRKKIKFSKHGFPSYLLKETDSVKVFFSEEEALAYIKDIEDYTIARYIQPSTNEISKIRVHWKSNLTYKVYLITNKIHPKRVEKPEKAPEILRYDFSKLKEIVGPDSFRSQEESPLIRAPTIKSVQSFPTCAATLKETLPIIKLEKPNFDMYILSDKLTSNWVITKLSYVEKEPLSMIENLAYIINNYNVIGSSITEMVVDFCKDSHKKWYVLQIPQVLAVKPIRSVSTTRLLGNIQEISLRTKIKNSNSSPYIDSLVKEIQESISMNDISIVRRKKFNKRIRDKNNTSLDFRVKRCMIEIEKNSNSFSIAHREFTSQESIEFYNQSRRIDRHGSFKRSFLSNSQDEKDASVPMMKKDQLLHTNFDHAKLEKRSKFQIKQSIKRFDKMKVSNMKIRLFKRELYFKYGGIKFVKNFVVTLYINLQNSQLFDTYFQVLGTENIMSLVNDYKKLFMVDMSYKDAVNLMKTFTFNEAQFKNYERIFIKTGIEMGITKIDIDILFSDLKRAFVRYSKEDFI